MNPRDKKIHLGYRIRNVLDKIAVRAEWKSPVFLFLPYLCRTVEFDGGFVFLVAFFWNPNLIGKNHISSFAQFFLCCDPDEFQQKSGRRCIRLLLIRYYGCIPRNLALNRKQQPRKDIFDPSSLDYLPTVSCGKQKTSAVLFYIILSY